METWLQGALRHQGSCNCRVRPRRRLSHQAKVAVMTATAVCSMTAMASSAARLSLKSAFTIEPSGKGDSDDPNCGSHHDSNDIIGGDRRQRKNGEGEVRHVLGLCWPVRACAVLRSVGAATTVQQYRGASLQLMPCTAPSCIMCTQVAPSTAEWMSHRFRWLLPVCLPACLF